MNQAKHDQRQLTINSGAVGWLLPQISDLTKIMDVVSCVEDDGYYVDSITNSVATYFLISDEYASEYLETADYLGFIWVGPHGDYIVSEAGIELLFRTPIPELCFALAKAVINSWFFVQLIKSAQDNGTFSEADIDSALITAALLNRALGSYEYDTEVTIRCRETLLSWLQWLTDDLHLFVRQDDKYIIRK